MTRRRSPGQELASILVLLVAVICFARPILAQTATPDPRAAKPERPTVATHAYTVTPGIVELESGVQFQYPTPASSVFGFGTLVKVGLTNSLQFDVTPGWVRVGTDGVDHSGVSDLVVGLKWHVADSVPVLSAFGLQSTIKLRTGSADFGTGTGTTDVNVLAISSRTIGPVSLDINAGYTHRSGEGRLAPTNSGLWTFSFGFPIKGPVSWDAEVFGSPRTGGPTGAPAIVAFLTGPTLTVNKGLVLDVGGIFNVTGYGGNAVHAGATWNAGRMWTPK